MFLKKKSIKQIYKNKFTNFNNKYIKTNSLKQIHKNKFTKTNSMFQKEQIRKTNLQKQIHTL